MLVPVLICSVLALGNMAMSADAPQTPAREVYRSGNYAEALRQLQPRAEQNEAEAQYYLGRMYENGEGVPKNLQQAAVWYRRAAAGGQARAQYKLAIGYAFGLAGARKDEPEAVTWLKKSAEGGYKRAQRVLARAYAEGRFGLPRDAKQADYWARQAGVNP